MAEHPPEVALDPRIIRRFQWASTLNGLAFGLEISALPIYFQGLSLPPALYGLLVGLAWLVSLVVRFPIGTLALRFGNRPLMNAGAWLYAPLSWALLISGNVPLFFLIRLLNGVARSLMVLPLRSWFTELCPRPRLAHELGRLNAGFAIGQSLVGGFGGPLLLSALGPLGLLGILGALPLVIWWLLRPAPPDHPAASARAAAGTATPALLWVAAPCGLAANSALTANAAFFPQLVQELGWPTAVVGALLFIQGACAVWLAWHSGRIIGRWGEAAPVLVGHVLVIAAALVLCFAPLGPALPLVAALCGTASGTLPVLAMTLAARSLASRSQGISVHETYISLGLGAGPFLGGLAIQVLGTPRAALLAGGLFAIAGLVTTLWQRRTLQPAHAG